MAFALEERPAELKNRTRVEILANILDIASPKGALKTHIMYRANLSHKQLDKYLGFLQENSLLREIVDPDSGSRKFAVTDRGLEFLRDYSRLSAYFIERRA